MPDIYQDFQIQAPIERVFQAISSPEEVSAWWSFSTSGKPTPDAVYELDFGPGYHWKARVTACSPPESFEWELTDADSDWVGTRVGFKLEQSGDKTNVQFHHTGWPEPNAHYRISCYCWAMYLRILKRFVEHGEFVPYADRLNV